MKQYFLYLKNYIKKCFSTLSQKNNNTHTTDNAPQASENPCFIVCETGRVQSSNKAGTHFILLSKGYINNILLHDGFDNAAVYRLLNTSLKHFEENDNFVYISEALPNENKFLITRCQKTENNTPQNADNDIQTLGGYFNNISQTITASFGGHDQSQAFFDSSEILNLTKKIRTVIKNDSELFEHLRKFGQSESKRHLGAINFGNDPRNPFNAEAQKIFRIFEYFIKDHDNHPQDSSQEYSEVPHISVDIPLNLSSEKQDIHNNFSQTTQNAISLDFIVKNSPLATVILDNNDIIIDHNQAFLDLFNLEVCTEKVFKNYFPSQDYEKIDTTSDNSATEIHIFTPLERVLNIKICFDKAKNQKICYLNDVSAEKNLEQKFNQAQKMQAIGQLAGGVAHDFNNLLTAILGHTELLMNRFSPADFVYADLLQIRNNANRAGNLVNQLLAFSRRQTLKPEVIVLTDILPDICRMLERLVGERITLKTNYTPSLQAIKADKTQLEQVIINLGVNARDAMADTGGTLSITTENICEKQALLEGHNIMPAMDYVKVTVSDTGTGMSDEIKAKIFEPFFTTKEQGKGTGLGLSTVYGIVKQSNGFIFVDSELNKGTQFRIYFPITTEQQTPIINTDDVPENHANLITDAPHTKTILLVEDEDSVRAFAVRALELRGYNVLVADCGEEALSIFEQRHADINLIITDVMMPGLSGPEWIKEAQKIKANLNVIFMSGYTQDYFRDDNAFNLDGIETLFLSKPFSLKKFNETIQNACRS